MQVIGQAHSMLHANGILRIQTDIRIGTRTDKPQHFSEKVSKVESILAGDVSTKAEGASGGSKIDAEGNEGHVAGDAKINARSGSESAGHGTGVKTDLPGAADAEGNNNTKQGP
jgi:hypothetical protein